PALRHGRHQEDRPHRVEDLPSGPGRRRARLHRRPRLVRQGAARTVSAPHESFVPLRTGLRYHLLEWGAEHAASAHTVLLVHGFLDFAWGWNDVATRLAAAGLHVVAPDMRGHGDSERVGAGGYYHFMDYVADLAEVVRLSARTTLSLV